MLFTGKNNREYESPLLIIRDELGIRMVDLCKEAGCSATQVYDLAYGMSWPVYVKDWKIKPYVEKICDILGVTVEELFPLFFCKVREKQFENEELFISEYTLKISENTESRFASTEIYQKLNDKQYAKLSKRTKKILYKYFFEEKTYREIGENFNIHQERVRQIILKVLRRWRLGNGDLYHDWKETEEIFV
jgi:RNA polymerase sigma factor (sigma-70 family)